MNVHKKLENLGFSIFSPESNSHPQTNPSYVRESRLGNLDYAIEFDIRSVNPNNIIHGGALYSFAERILAHTFAKQLKRKPTILNLKVEYQSAVKPTTVVYGTCTLRKDGGYIAFVQVTLSTENGTVMTIDGTLQTSLNEKNNASDRTEYTEPKSTHSLSNTSLKHFKEFKIQGNYAKIYGPMLYVKSSSGEYICGANLNSEWGTGPLFSFADDLMGRAVSASTRRYSATIALDASFLTEKVPTGWFQGKVESLITKNNSAFVKCLVTHENYSILSVIGIWRLFKYYE